MVESAKEATPNPKTDENDDIWHKPFNTHPYCVSKDETPVQVRERSLKAREIGKNLTADYLTARRPRPFISNSELHKWGGRDNFIGMYEDFYYYFMTDPFMNTLFDLTKEEADHKMHGRRLGTFFLSFFGDDDEYQKLRGGHPVSNLNKAHNRSKNCPLRGHYKGAAFTLNQMRTWIGYQHMAAEGRGFKGEEYKTVMLWVLNGLAIYHPFIDDVANEKGNTQ